MGICIINPKEVALYWLGEGVSSVPLYFRTKIPSVKWTEYRTHLPTETIINLWYQEPRNIALVTGWQRLICLDFDEIGNYCAWHCWQLEHNPKLVQTYKSLTSRGIHCFFYLKEEVRLTTIQHALFELKSGGKLVTIPPSVHESGKAYRPMSDFENIQVVSVEQILNYSPLALHPVEVVWPTRSRFAPTQFEPEKDLISEIKAKVKILSFFPGAVKVAEGYYRADCPFHGHRSNFWISTQLNICGCYAGCLGKNSVDVIEFFSRLNKISTKEAILILSKEL